MSKYTGVESVIESLLLLDHKLTKLNLHEKISIYIFGGSALMFISNFRATSDIDVYIGTQGLDKHVIELFNDYNVNSSLESVMYFPPYEDFKDRAKKVAVDFTCLDVYVASKEDIVLSKVFSSRQTTKDFDDLVKHSDILDKVDMNYVKEMYDEYLSYNNFRSTRHNNLDEIIEARKLYKKTGKY